MKKVILATTMIFLALQIPSFSDNAEQCFLNHCNSPEFYTQQVKPLLPKKRKGQVKPLEIEEPEVKKVYGKGVATIFEGNVENARRAALRTAYADAVSQGCKIEIGSMSLIRNVKTVSDIVMSRSRGFIRSFNILNEGVSEKDLTKYEVFIEAEVVDKGKALGNEIEGLRLYLEVLGNPQLLIILPESQIKRDALDLSEVKKDKIDLEFKDKDTHVKVSKESFDKSAKDIDKVDIQKEKDKGTVFRSAEAALAQVFTEYGYQVITSDDLIADELCSPEDLAKAKAGVTTKIKDIARLANIDLALFGVLRTTQQVTKPAGVEMVKVVAEASAKALIVSSGKVINAFHHTVQAANFSDLMAYSDCLDKVASNIADVLAWKIPQILSSDYRETRLILSEMNPDHAQDLKDALKGMTGVELVRFAKIPTQYNPKAEYILLSGFIPLDLADNEN